MTTNHDRRTVLKLLGASVATGIGGIGTATAQNKPTKGRLRKMGHSLLSNPPGGYAEESIRADGQYAVLGSFIGTGGSTLVDISNPTRPTEVHNLPSIGSVWNADVAFDRRNGLYYRSQEGDNKADTFAGVEVIDYGHADGTPSDPQVLARFEAGPTHNVHAHPVGDVLYTTNKPSEERAGSLGVWDTSDPSNPEPIGFFGPNGDLHDMVVDPDRNLLHCAFIGGGDFAGYAILDISDPLEPSTLGTFNYAGRPGYTKERLANGEPGFEGCHYANYDPERGIAVVGDEIGSGPPGGKHVFDIGWGEGSPENPVHIGFTYSPNAKVQGESITEVFDWTGHNFDIIPKGDNTLLVSGDYHEGTVVYDISDPTDPTPTDLYRTDDGATQEVNDLEAFDLGEAPMAWGADYNAARDLVVTSDFFTGIYVFKVTPSASGGKGSGNGKGGR